MHIYIRIRPTVRRKTENVFFSFINLIHIITTHFATSKHLSNFLLHDFDKEYFSYNHNIILKGPCTKFGVEHMLNRNRSVQKMT